MIDLLLVLTGIVKMVLKYLPSLPFNTTNSTHRRTACCKLEVRPLDFPQSGGNNLPRN
jgi:hypothetical protein